MVSRQSRSTSTTRASLQMFVTSRHNVKSQVFTILDKLTNTATGLDYLPAWFLRLGAPIFCKPVARLFNKSIVTSVVPRQWQYTSIRPVPKSSTPVEHSDFRPISITPVLCRTLERIIVKKFLYPAILLPPTTLCFDDQYAFRPTGSTTAALIAILQSVTDLLSTNPFVVVLAVDFSEAFDTVRHASLFRKMALLNVPDPVYNNGWWTSSMTTNIVRALVTEYQLTRRSRLASYRGLL